MKTTTIILIISAVLVLSFFVAQAFVMKSTNSIEQLSYEVIDQVGDVEIRKYDPALFTAVTMGSSSYKESSGQGFSTLAGYIFGKNERSEKIAMTSPVAMELEDSITMKFMVPSEYAKGDLPQPMDKRIRFEQEEGKVLAAIRFGGWANDQRVEEFKSKLIAVLEENDIEHTGKFSFMGYNPPFEVVNRRNEVAVELTSYPQ